VVRWQSKKVTAVEAHEIFEDLRYHINTGLGRRNEEEAIR
jgi:hypothetical protein